MIDCFFNSSTERKDCIYLDFFVGRGIQSKIMQKVVPAEIVNLGRLFAKSLK